MLFRILLKCLIVVVFGFIATFAHAQDGGDEGGGGGNEPPPSTIICNTCSTALEAGAEALRRGLAPGGVMDVTSYGNGSNMRWKVTRSSSGTELNVNQIAGPGTGTILTGTGFGGGGGGGDYGAWNTAIGDGGMMWNCVTPWSMYCY